MTFRQQIVFWFFVLAGLLGFVWVLNDMLTPFVLGFVIAYLTGPLVVRLHRLGVSRTLAVSFVLSSFVFAIVFAVLASFPVLQSQGALFVEAVPSYIAQLREWAMPLMEKLSGYVSSDALSPAVKENAGQYAGKALSWISGVLTNIWSGGMAVFDVLSLIIVTPVVSFYLLRDWDRIVAKIDGWLPREHAKTVHRLFGEMDASISGFMRGQAMVCLCLGTIYGTALEVAGVNFGFLIGAVAGVLSFIPYVGSIVGFITAVLVAWFQFKTLMMLMVVCGIFGVGQLIEGNVLTPKLVGDKVRLHPLWIIFALMAGGSLFGFVGIMIGVPVAAVIGVMVRFGLERYLESPFYKGRFQTAKK